MRPVIRLVLALLLMLAAPLRAEPLSGQDVNDLILQALAEAGQGGTPVLSLHRGFPPCTTRPRRAGAPWTSPVQTLRDGPGVSASMVASPWPAPRVQPVPRRRSPRPSS